MLLMRKLLTRTTNIRRIALGSMSNRTPKPPIASRSMQDGSGVDSTGVASISKIGVPLSDITALLQLARLLTKGKLAGILKSSVLVEVGGKFVMASNRMLDRITVCQARAISVAQEERLHLKANRKLASGGRVMCVTGNGLGKGLANLWSRKKITKKAQAGRGQETIWEISIGSIVDNPQFLHIHKKWGCDGLAIRYRL
jgi:hypothetical protein